MMRWVQITDVGDTPLIVDEKVDKHRFKEINEQALKDSGIPATCEPQLLGITKASPHQRVLHLRGLPSRRPPGCSPRPPWRVAWTTCAA